MSSVKNEAEAKVERVEDSGAARTSSVQLQEVKETVLNQAERFKVNGSQVLQQGWSTAKQVKDEVDDKYLRPTRRAAVAAFAQHPLAVTVSC